MKRAFYLLVFLFLIGQSERLSAEPFHAAYGDTVNRLNRHGVEVGHWLFFYPGGQLQIDAWFEENDELLRPVTIRRKTFYENGALQTYSGGDTTETWYDNGVLQVRAIRTYKNTDTLVSTVTYFHSGKIESLTVERRFSQDHYIVDTLDSTLFIVSKYERNESYYENGQREFVMGDTCHWWYESGSPMKCSWGDTAVGYYESGTIKTQERRWREKDPENGIVSYSLSAGYSEDGKKASLLFVREESDAYGRTTETRYEWKWNGQGKMIVRPKNWKGPLPQ